MMHLVLHTLNAMYYRGDHILDCIIFQKLFLIIHHHHISNYILRLQDVHTVNKFTVLEKQLGY